MTNPFLYKNLSLYFVVCMLYYLSEDKLCSFKIKKIVDNMLHSIVRAISVNKPYSLRFYMVVKVIKNVDFQQKHYFYFQCKKNFDSKKTNKALRNNFYVIPNVFVSI